jgi:hypothetical protein
MAEGEKITRTVAPDHDAHTILVAFGREQAVEKPRMVLFPVTSSPTRNEARG